MRKDQELLLQAARQGDSAIVQKILIQRRSGPLASLRRGPGANVQDSTGFTPLHHAALNGHTEIVSLLLSAEASPTIKDAKGSAPLHLAAWNGHEDIVAMLLAHKSHKEDLDVDLKTNSGDTALHYAAQFGHRGAVTQLLKKNADPQARNNKQETPLDLAAQFGRVDVVEELIRHSPCIVDQYKASRHRGTLFNSTPLHRASNNGHGSVVTILLKAGVDPNCRTHQGTALHVAATFGKLDVARVLLERGADPRVRDEGGRNVLEVIATLPEKLAVNLERLILKYSTVKGLVECLPPIPTIDSPEYEHAISIGSYNMNGADRRQQAVERQVTTNVKSSLSKYQPHRLVKKIASKCFGVKFNSAPNISQQGLSSEIDKGPKSPTLQIGNSKFFNFMSRSKEECSAIVCNDEFDTISLDRFPTFNRSHTANTSNRSYPGFKTSLPNIVENPEGDSDSDASNESSSSFENLTPSCLNQKQRFPLPNLVEHEAESLEKESVKAASNVSQVHQSETKKVRLINRESSRQYVNVTIQKVTLQPVPAARSTNAITAKPDIIDTQPLGVYENVILKEQLKPEPAKRTIVPKTEVEDNMVENPVPPPKPKVTEPLLSVESDDSFGESMEDIMMSKKSTSFMRRRKPTNWTFLEKTKPKTIIRHKSIRSESSTTTEVLTLEDVDCCSDISTLINNRLSATLPRSSFHSEKTLTPRDQFRTLPRSISKDVVENYHIKGTGRCIYQGPSLNEFLKVFNRDTLRADDVNNRFSTSAICFCRPETMIKHSKSEGDILDIIDIDVDNVNLDSYLKSVRNSINSFQCYCDATSSCTLNHKKSNSYTVHFTPAKRSMSYPNLCDIEIAVGARDIDLISNSTENDTSLTFGALSETSSIHSEVSCQKSGTLDTKRTDAIIPDLPFDDAEVIFKKPLKHSKSFKPTFDPSVQQALSKYYTIDSGVSSYTKSDSSTSCDPSGQNDSVKTADDLIQYDSGNQCDASSTENDQVEDLIDSGSGFGREGDDYSLSSAASSQQHEYNKISPTPPKKPPRRNLSVSPTHASGPTPCFTYGHMSRAEHARSQDDLDDMQVNKPYLKLGSSVDHCYDAKSFQEYHQEQKISPRPVPKPRPSIQNRQQPVAITTMYENVVIKEQNPKRKLRRNYENFEPRKFSSQEKSSMESLLDDSGFCYEGDKVEMPSSPTHYEQPPTPEHPPPSARQAEMCIHERIRPLSQEYKRRSCGLRDSWTEPERCISRSSWSEDGILFRDSWNETHIPTGEFWHDDRYLMRRGSSGSAASSITTDNAIDEYVAAAPFGGLFKGSTTQLESVGLRPVPVERPRTLRKLRNVYEPSPETDNNNCGDIMEVSARRRTNSDQSVGDKSLSILSPFDEQEEWANISRIMESFGSKLVRESVFVSELEQEFQSRLGLSCSESSLSPSIASTIGQWLYSVGLVDYESVFQTHGYDDLDFINGLLDENDLREMGVDESERPKILAEISQLPRKIQEVASKQNKNKFEEQNSSVDEWLRQINLEQYSETFRKHLYLDMERVRNIWEVELTAVLEIKKRGHRKRILASVSGERNGPVAHAEDINVDLNNLKNNIQQLKEDIKDKLPVENKPKPLPIHSLNIPPGGETLKRSKKNRPAPQPPKAADLEIRAPSELLVGVPGALETKWRHKPFILVTGAVTYVANYLGSTVVKELRGTESTKKSIQKLKKSTKEPRDSPDIILSISYRGVKFLNTITKELVCEHEIRNIHCACQDADDLTHFAYITKDHASKCHYCHVFRVATMAQATEVILTLGEAFEVAYQMALREAQIAKSITKQKNPTPATNNQQTKTPTHDLKEKYNHGRSHSITEIKLNGHQLKIAPIPTSLSNEDFQYSKDGSKGYLKAPIASTEEL